MTDKSQSTALHLAFVKYEPLEVIRTLVQSFEDREDREDYVNLMNKDQSTAQHLASTNKLSRDFRPVIEFLVDEGAKLNLADGDGCVALHYACESGNLELVKYLYKLDRSVIKNHLVPTIGSGHVFKWLWWLVNMTSLHGCCES
jgi:ankyrin repeat protein